MNNDRLTRLTLCERACAGIPDAELSGLRVGELLEFLRHHAAKPPDDSGEIHFQILAKAALAKAGAK